MAEDDFGFWLGRIGKDRPFAHQLRRAINLAGGDRLPAVRRFGGGRLSRGAGVGLVLGASDRFAGARSRRVVVKARFVKLAGKGGRSAVAHLRYLQRDGTTRESERGFFYGADRDVADGKTFLERGQADRHQFRFIVAPEDGGHYEDLKPLVRRWMQQVEQDLRTELDWVAIDHFDTGHPHSHVLVRGIDDRGKDLVIARDYLSRGLAGRAAELVNLDLGPRTDREIEQARQREVAQERFTGLDRRLLLARDADGRVFARHGDSVEQTLRAARLFTLTRMGLAIEDAGGYRLEEDLEDRLRTMGRRGDIIATMHATLKQRVPEIAPKDYAIYDPAEGRPLVGRVIDRGLADEHADRHYLIVAGTDGRSHYVDLGVTSLSELEERPEIVRVVPVPSKIRDVDLRISEIASAHHGIYSVDAHRQQDPIATEAFVQAHVRRLEAMRRAGAGVERLPDGTWKIALDHPQRALAFDQGIATSRPVAIQTLATRPIERLARHDGLTWLDEQLVAETPEKLERGFGAQVRHALDERQKWLIGQGLLWNEGGGMVYRADLLSELRGRDLQRIAGQLSKDTGLDFAAHEGGRIAGIYRQAVSVGTETYAVIEGERAFTLVPWRPVLDKQLGRHVSGFDRGGTISWDFGRERSGPSISNG